MTFDVSTLLVATLACVWGTQSISNVFAKQRNLKYDGRSWIWSSRKHGTDLIHRNPKKSEAKQSICKTGGIKVLENKAFWITRADKYENQWKPMRICASKHQMITPSESERSAAEAVACKQKRRTSTHRCTHSQFFWHSPGLWPMACSDIHLCMFPVYAICSRRTNASLFYLFRSPGFKMLWFSTL